ncbi:MAG TPA: biosynthetic-type acetolactate synthase large subunit [Terriglobales bacterium]|nr:biosynthetic-type acetolactate synthase large subunit [Terriglobales bacterium]
MRKGAQIVLDCMRAEGVELAFGYPGGAIMPLYDALEGSGIRHVLTRHEQGAVFAAEGYARATGKVGVAIATSGPGATNLVTGIADAKMDSVPLVCITGQVRSPLIGSDAFQETDVFGMTLSLTKWNRLVRSTEELPRVIAEAFYWARSGRPGPVVVDIPSDLLKANAEFNGPVEFVPPRAAAQFGNEWTFPATLIAMLQQAKRPVALVGAGAKLSGAVDDLQQLLDLLNIPTFATVHGLGAVKQDSPYYLGMVGMHGTRAANLALDETDLLVVFGARLDDRVTGEPTRFAPHAKIVHFEIDPAQLDRVRPSELAVIGDLAETIPAFCEKASHSHLPDFSHWRAVACGSDRAEPRKTGLAHPTKGFLEALFRHMPADGSGTILADVGQHQMWAAQVYRNSTPRGFITSGGLGAMGFALPAAIGVQLAKPGTTVLCVQGDGGFQMNIQELATVHRLGLPIKMVIIDNKYLGMVRQWQELFYQRNYAETDLSDNPNFVEIAKAYKISAQLIREEEFMDAAGRGAAAYKMGRFFESNEPELLVFECHPEANVYPMVPAGAALSEMVFEGETT